MDWKLFIARRIYRSNEGGKEVSKPAVRIAMLGIAIGLAVMIVSVAVVIGFKHEVRDKVVGLGSDIVITTFRQPTPQYRRPTPDATCPKRRSDNEHPSHRPRYCNRRKVL